LHEESDKPRYEKLIKRFKQEKVLYNPLIAGRIKNEFILIDGANRYKALKILKCKLLLCQVVNYLTKPIVLKSWYHYSDKMDIEDARQYAEKNSLRYKYILNSEKLI